ncbi:MAG: YbjN domain-containing protein, partial [Deltaproteobacteria bacterium]|nr:YbjN domain-containing protein [Deltaproteobacteria bacterium]
VLELAEVSDKAALFEELLRLNAADLVHGAYGILDDAVVLTCTLQVENLDYNELQGVLDDFSLALANHYEKLSKFRVAT